MRRTVWLILSVFSILLCLFLYLDSYSDYFNIIRADYYFKKNNIDYAIKYYEQAFENGSKNSDARDNYVNLVINSPLDADAQERLVRFIKYPVGDSARDKAMAFLLELRYEIHGKYPDNYISQGTYNQKILRWSGPEITYSYTNPEVAPEYFVKEIDSAFAEWGKSLDGIIKFKKTEDNSDIVISFNDTKIDANENEKYIAAITKPNINTNILKNMITEYYITTPDGNNFTENQVYNTALHEIGHDLGFMGHCSYPNNIMYMATDSKTASGDLRKKLTKADINTIKLLYKIKPDITNKKIITGEYTKYLVLGNDADVANAKMREAKSYIQKAPNLSSGYIDLADAYISTEEYPKALKALNQALSLAKDEDTVYMIYYNLALVNFFMSDYKNAKIYLEKSGDYKNTESAQYLLARIYTLTQSTKEAIAMYEDLIARNSANIEYIIGLTNIYVKDRRYLKARAVLKEFVSKNPNEKHNPKLAPYGILRVLL